MNSFFQIARDCKEFARISGTILALDTASAYVLIKGVSMTCAAPSTLRIVAGVAIAALGAATLKHSLQWSYNFCLLSDSKRAKLRNPENTIKICKNILESVLCKNILIASARSLICPATA